MPLQAWQRGGADRTPELSEAFYREIWEHPIPAEREVVAALAHASGLLDFYVWITWKSRTVKDQPAQRRAPAYAQDLSLTRRDDGAALGRRRPAHDRTELSQDYGVPGPVDAESGVGSEGSVRSAGGGVI